MTLFPVPARQTGRADFPHPAFSHSSGLRSRQVTTTIWNAVEAESLVEILIGDLGETNALALRSSHQPTSESPLSVTTDAVIDRHDRSLIEIAAPAA